MKITAENATFEVLSSGTAFPEACVFETTQGDIPDPLKRADSLYLPCVFPSMLPGGPPLASYLLWPTHEEAEAALRAVLSGSYGDAHFASSVRVHFASKFCFDCSKVFPTLSIDPGLPYPGASDLLLQKVRRWKVLPCPSCGGSFRQLVVRILEEEPNQSSEPTALLGRGSP